MGERSLQDKVLVTFVCLRRPWFGGKHGRPVHRRPCRVCNAWVEQYWLCDGATGLPEVTCDAVLCDQCRYRPDPTRDVDWCPDCRKATQRS